MSEQEQVARQIKEEDDVATSFRELREYAMGNLDVDHDHLHPLAGLIDDDEVREVLGFMAENYEPSEEMPKDFWETAFAEKALRKFATEIATQAIDEGNLSQVSYITGLPSYESDVSGLQATNQLVDWLVHSEQCKLVYLAALMGRGKTDLSLLFMEVINDHFQRLQRSVGDEVDVEEPEFAANFWVDAGEDAHVKTIDNYDDLLEWAERGNSEMERWFIFDEASTELTAQSGKNAQDVAETFAPFVKKMRKMGVNMIVIGHDKGDVHVAIRSIADFVDKTGLKTASFYAGIKQREPTGHLFDLDGLPPTSWEFDTDDTADWDWCEETQESIEQGISDEEFRDWRDKRIARLYSQTDVSQQDLANAMGLSQSAVSTAIKRIEVKTDESGNSKVPA